MTAKAWTRSSRWLRSVTSGLCDQPVAVAPTAFSLCAEAQVAELRGQYEAASELYVRAADLALTHSGCRELLLKAVTVAKLSGRVQWSQTFYAVELSLLKVTADVDEHQATIPGTHPHQEILRSHYDGTYPSEVDAQVTYDACDVVMQEHAAQRRQG